MNTIVIWAYRFFYSLAKAVLLLLCKFTHLKIQNWIKLREAYLQINWSQFQLKNCYWFHASSGEIEYIKSIIFELKKRTPHCQIVVTYSSISAEKLFNNIKEHVTLFVPLPWDQPSHLLKLIHHIQPRVLVFARTDLWPELIEQANRFRIPTVVVSYFPSLKWSHRFLLKWLLKKIDYISCVNEDVKKKIQQLLGLTSKNQKITADGDTRFDQVFNRLQQQPRLRLQPKAHHKILTFGSTWPEDEQLLFPLVPQILKLGYQIIWAPHEIKSTDLEKSHKIFKELQINTLTLSEENQLTNISQDCEPPTLNCDLLIIDRIGYLADAYRFSQAAFVGGSFKAKVHSIMEPLCCGVPVCVGPFFKNSPEALLVLSHTDPQLIYQAANSAELFKQFVKIYSEHNEETQQKIIQVMKNHTQASQQIANYLISL